MEEDGLHKQCYPRKTIPFSTIQGNEILPGDTHQR